VATARSRPKGKNGGGGLRVEKGVFRVPTFSDVVAGEVGIEGTGTSFRVVYVNDLPLRVPDSRVQIVTHPHTDQMPAIAQRIIAPKIVALKVRHIYRQYSLKPEVIPWEKYKRTFHYFKGTPVFSSVMEFPDFVVIGESAEQSSLIDEYYHRYPKGIVVRTPPRDTDEERVEIPADWLLANNTVMHARIPNVLPKICPTLRDMDYNRRLEEAVREYIRSKRIF
jgi:hypothetical protein